MSRDEPPHGEVPAPAPARFTNAEGPVVPRISRRKEAALIAGLLLYGAVMWMWGTGRTDIKGSMEAMRAVGTRNMMRTGDYIVPRLGTKVYIAKPPLFYWAVVGASRLLGDDVTETSVRLPSALAALATLLLVYVAARSVFGWTTAAIACLLMTMTPTVFNQARIGQVNMLLTLGVTLSLLSAFSLLEGGRHTWVYAAVCGLGLAMATMTKGQLGPLFFLPTVLLYVGFQQGGLLVQNWRVCAGYLALTAFLFWLTMALVIEVGSGAAALYVLPVGMLLYFGLGGGGDRKFRSWPWLVMLGTAAVLLAPWPVLVVRELTLGKSLAILKFETWEKLSDQVGRCNINPVWFYLRAFPPAALPGILFAPLAFLPVRRAGDSERRGRLRLFLCCWLGAAFVLFSVGARGKGVRYLLPTVPALVILAADVIVGAQRGALRPWASRYVRRVAAAATYALGLFLPLSLIAWFGLGLPFSGWVVAIVVTTAAGAALGIYWHRVRKYSWAPLVGLALTLIGPKMVLDFGRSQVFNRTDSRRVECDRIRSGVPAGEDLYVYASHPEGMHPSCVFYLNGRPFEWYANDPGWLIRKRRLFVCLEARQLSHFPTPAGFRQEVLRRVPWKRGELVLLRLTRLLCPAG